MSVEPPREVHAVSPIRPVTETGAPPRERQPRKAATRRKNTKRWKWFREFGLPTASAIAASLLITAGGFLYTQLSAVKDLPRWRSEVETWRQTADQRQRQLEAWQQEAREQSKTVESLKIKTEDAENRLQDLQTEIVAVRTRVEDLRDLLRPGARRTASVELPAPVRGVSFVLAAAPGVFEPAAEPLTPVEPVLVASDDADDSVAEVTERPEERPVRTFVFRPIVIGDAHMSRSNFADPVTRRPPTDLSMLRAVRAAYGH